MSQPSPRRLLGIVSHAGGFITHARFAPSLAVAAVLACGLALGCASTQTGPADGVGDGAAQNVVSGNTTPESDTAPVDAMTKQSVEAKIARPIADIVEKLRTAGETPGRNAGLYSTPFVKVDAKGRLHTNVLVAEWGAEERKALEAAGATIEVAHERLKIVQAWIPSERVADVAALPFVTKITPPSYATPR